MRPKRSVAAAVVAALSMGGCASIMGVDSSDYINAADVLCDCTREQDACKGQVEGVIEKNAEVEQTALDCLAEVGQNCQAIYACVGKSYCGDFNDRCALDDDGNAVLACCDGGTCEGSTCLRSEGTACGEGKNSGCAKGLACIDGICAAACAGLGDTCAGGGKCCAELICGDDATCQPKECSPQGGECGNGLPDCCTGLTCREGLKTCAKR